MLKLLKLPNLYALKEKNKMKLAHEIISDHVFRGRTSGFVNSVTKMIYGAKFYNDEKAFNALCRLCIGDIKINNIDAIASINTRDSHYNLPQRMAQVIAAHFNIPYISALSNKNTACSSRVENKRILLFDDVIYTGKTLTKASALIYKSGAQSVTCFAIARSRSFKI